MTFQGRLVVCASILVGIAVLPAQTAGLVEALLDFNKEREENRKKQLKLSSSNTPLTGYDVVKEDDEDCVCPVCNSSPHRIDAFYCWSCGSKL